jgi:hypothetical protein
MTKKPPRPDWLRPLPRPLIIPEVMTLKTLADVRAFLKLLPVEFRQRHTWQCVATNLTSAARGADVVDLFVSLRMVLMLERAKCRLG